MPRTQRQWLVQETISPAQQHSARTEGYAHDDEDAEREHLHHAHDAEQARISDQVHSVPALTNRLRLVEEAIEDRAISHRAARKRHEREYTEKLLELIEFANSLTDRELKRVGRETLALLEEALKDLE